MFKINSPGSDILQIKLHIGHVVQKEFKADGNKTNPSGDKKMLYSLSLSFLLLPHLPNCDIKGLSSLGKINWPIHYHVD